jgi:hypothetical protein
MNTTTCNISDKPSSFAHGQRVAVEWENEGEALATIDGVYYWGNIVTLTLTYDNDDSFKRRSFVWRRAYGELKVNDPNQWSPKFRMV